MKARGKPAVRKARPTATSPHRTKKTARTKVGAPPTRLAGKTTTARLPAREALLEAAAGLFAARGPAAVSTREIAAAAVVNSGLIHRHFGTKDELLRAALSRLAQGISVAVESPAGDADDLLRFFDATREQAAYWTLLARCLLDGRDIEELQGEFPTIRRLTERLAGLRDRGAVKRNVEPRVLAALLAAMGLGWLVFEPFLLAAADLASADREAVRQEVRSAVISMLS
jgi:AcrR family transcriptional regulator